MYQLTFSQKLARSKRRKFYNRRKRRLLRRSSRRQQLSIVPFLANGLFSLDNVVLSRHPVVSDVVAKKRPLDNDQRVPGEPDLKLTFPSNSDQVVPVVNKGPHWRNKFMFQHEFVNGIPYEQYRKLAPVIRKELDLVFSPAENFQSRSLGGRSSFSYTDEFGRTNNAYPYEVVYEKDRPVGVLLPESSHRIRFGDFVRRLNAGAGLDINKNREMYGKTLYGRNHPKRLTLNIDSDDLTVIKPNRESLPNLLNVWSGGSGRTISDVAMKSHLNQIYVVRNGDFRSGNWYDYDTAARKLDDATNGLFSKNIKPHFGGAGNHGQWFTLTRAYDTNDNVGPSVNFSPVTFYSGDLTSQSVFEIMRNHPRGKVRGEFLNPGLFEALNDAHQKLLIHDAYTKGYEALANKT